MALELVGGAVLGTAVAELLKAVKDAKEKDTNFQQALTRLECTLRSVTPRVKKIIKLNKKLNIPNHEVKELITILQNGKTLIHKCSRISSINLVRKGQYSNQLLELDYSLLRYFQTILPLDHVRDTKEMLLMIRDLHKGLVGVKDEEGQSSSSDSDEDSEIQSCQDPKELDTMKQATDAEGKKVNRGTKTWKDRLKGWLYDFDLENTTTSLIEENVKLAPEIEEIEESRGQFRLKRCIYNFVMEDMTYDIDPFPRGLEKRRYSIKDCECTTTRKHGKVMAMWYKEVMMQCEEDHFGEWPREVIPYEKMVEKKEFVDQMKRLRNVGNHPNIVPPIGYCFHDDGTLLFYDNIPRISWNRKFSLYSQLHEDQPRRYGMYVPPRDSPDLVWDNKLKISLGVARGISHLHFVGFVHGNLNTSNVLLTSDFDTYISAYGLKYFSSATQQSDVHSFGLLLIEMLFRRNPREEMKNRYGRNYDWKAYCVDLKSDRRYRTNRPKECKMMDIAIECVVDPDKWYNMEDLVVMLKKME